MTLNYVDLNIVPDSEVVQAPVNQRLNTVQEEIPIILNYADLNIVPDSAIEIIYRTPTDENCIIKPSTSNAEIDMGDIKLPVTMKKRGRPKGRANTVIGLKAKRHKKKTNPFSLS
ncbi:hypothetical protein RI129_004013 [Pyrocoelia pectoralis]|uniref:Uncharacterized protein n=1 Tax=Pyrocoelia pectoralis TaxID=417401 RepID=A0AAN7VQR0_9COLE